jgi:hypothetical protein
VNEFERLSSEKPGDEVEGERAPVPGKHTLTAALQRKAGPTGPGTFAEAASLVGAGGGAALDTGVQRQMEGSFGADFSSVRVHQDSAQASSVGALAYTQGDDVHFAPGQYAPGSQSGNELIGHELTHVVQQREGRVATPQAKGAPINDDAGLEAEADTMGAAAARGEVVRTGALSAAASGPIQAKAIQKKDGLTDGKVTREDFAGKATADKGDKDAHEAHAKADNEATLAQHASDITKGEARSEAEMLAAVEKGAYPRFIARVGPRDNFSYGSFANPGRPFVFATEPADLRGLKPAMAMYKVGWTKEWIKPNIGKEIVVCVFDTTVAVENPAEGTKKKVEQGKMEWPELKAAAIADSKFKTAAEAKGITLAELPELFDICSQTPVKGDFRTGDAAKKQKCGVLREIIDSQYGANALYTGMGATLRQDGGLGGREVMIRPNGTGLKLTPDNHTFASLGTMSQGDYDSLP